MQAEDRGLPGRLSAALSRCFELPHLALESKRFGERVVRLPLGRSALDALHGGAVARAFAAAGAKVFLDDRVGLRLEGRAYWIDLPSEVGGDFTQTEGSLGLVLRF